jgi:hypothetical protein
MSVGNAEVEADDISVREHCRGAPGNQEKTSGTASKTQLKPRRQLDE